MQKETKKRRKTDGTVWIWIWSSDEETLTIFYDFTTLSFFLWFLLLCYFLVLILLLTLASVWAVFFPFPTIFILNYCSATHFSPFPFFLFHAILSLYLSLPLESLITTIWVWCYTYETHEEYRIGIKLHVVSYKYVLCLNWIWKAMRKEEKKYRRMEKKGQTLYYVYLYNIIFLIRNIPLLENRDTKTRHAKHIQLRWRRWRWYTSYWSRSTYDQHFPLLHPNKQQHYP